MNRLLVMAAAVVLFVGCAASELPPDAGFGTETTLVAAFTAGAAEDGAVIYIVRSGEDCVVTAKVKRIGGDAWTDPTPVNCAAAYLFAEALAAGKER